MDDESEPLGLRTLRKWADMIEQDLKGLHKAEQPAVMDVGSKALALFAKAAKKGYDCEDMSKGDEVPMAEDEAPIEDKEMEPVEIEGKWAIYNPTDDEYLGEFESQEEAQNGISDMAKPEEAAKCKEWKRRKANLKQLRDVLVKGLTKATHNLIKEQSEVLDDLAGSTDLQKRYKGTVLGVSAALKSVLNKDAEPVTEKAEEMSEEEQKEVLCSLKNLSTQLNGMDRQLYQRFGRAYRG